MTSRLASRMLSPELVGDRHYRVAREVQRLAKARTTISHCACSNQILASGACPVCEMEAGGGPIGLGVDGSASNDASNLMQEVRAAFLLHLELSSADGLANLPSAAGDIAVEPLAEQTLVVGGDMSRGGVAAANGVKTAVFLAADFLRQRVVGEILQAFAVPPAQAAQDLLAVLWVEL